LEIYCLIELIQKMASHLYESLKPKSEYMDKTFKKTPEEYQQLLATSSTVYVGTYTAVNNYRV